MQICKRKKHIVELIRILQWHIKLMELCNKLMAIVENISQFIEQC